MFLLPPPETDPSAPLPAFRVDVALNVFSPSSYITTLRRGAEVVGEFEWVLVLSAHGLRVPGNVRWLTVLVCV